MVFLFLCFPQSSSSSSSSSAVSILVLIRILILTSSSHHPHPLRAHDSFSFCPSPSPFSPSFPFLLPSPSSPRPATQPFEKDVLEQVAVLDKTIPALQDELQTLRGQNQDGPSPLLFLTFLLSSPLSQEEIAPLLFPPPSLRLFLIPQPSSTTGRRNCVVVPMPSSPRTRPNPSSPSGRKRFLLFLFQVLLFLHLLSSSRLLTLAPALPRSLPISSFYPPSHLLPPTPHPPIGPARGRGAHRARLQPARRSFPPRRARGPRPGREAAR